MSGPSKVIVLDPDDRAARQVQLGFTREGVPVAVAAVTDARPELPGDTTGLVVVGGADGRALELLRATRRVLEENQLDVPIVFSGKGVRRTDAEAAGADEVVLHPAFLRDLVTIGRLLKGVPTERRAHLVGSLAETTGVFTLVRALSALGRSAVLTLIRGLRRGEIRFFHGEVTSAQVGLIHGQAAFHQLLLWTEARFEFHHEDVVRRQQIPLSPEELFSDAERFLEGVRAASGQLSPGMVLEQDVARISSLGKQVPTEVHGVLRLFDGHRVLADVLEDSPYRVFETLRVAQRACDVGLLRIRDAKRPKATWRAVLGIEEWLTGADRDPVVENAHSALESGPTRDSTSPKLKQKKRSKKKRRAQTPAPIAPPAAAKADIDWGALVPRTVGAEVGSLAGVVPATHTSGEIQLPTTSRSADRERLEALMDTEKRDRIFAKDIGLEPKVVLAADDAPAPATATGPEPAIARTKSPSKKAAATRTKPPSDPPASTPSMDPAPVVARAKTPSKDPAPVVARAKTPSVPPVIPAPPKKTESSGEIAIPRTKTASKPPAVARARTASVPPVLPAIPRPASKPDLVPPNVDDAELRAAAEDARLRAEASELKTKLAAKRAAEAEQQERETADVAKKLADAKAKADAETTRDPEPEDESWTGLREKALAADVEAAAEAVAAVSTPERGRDLVKQLVRGEGIVTSEDTHQKVVVHEHMTIDTTTNTARVTSQAVSTITSSAPQALDDEPSDGIVRQVTTVETAPVRRPPPGEVPPDDRPGARNGEIASRPKLPTAPPIGAEPSILIADMAAAHNAVAAVATAPAAAPPTPDIAKPSAELAVAEVRKDAVHAFSDAEEEFFRAGHGNTGKVPTFTPQETFDDLDEGYQPVGFWDRLRGKKPKPDRKK
ncbi:MAG: DUF4388 domain-containing protein [Myxococcales bacterium]|nr:DUF4388 domain-containing protein [Myxococcales bacterium]